jgi:hypothetical protein
LWETKKKYYTTICRTMLYHIQRTALVTVAANNVPTLSMYHIFTMHHRDLLDCLHNNTSFDIMEMHNQHTIYNYYLYHLRPLKIRILVWSFHGINRSTKVEHQDFGRGVNPHRSRVRGTTPTYRSGSLTI